MKVDFVVYINSNQVTGVNTSFQHLLYIISKSKYHLASFFTPYRYTHKNSAYAYNIQREYVFYESLEWTI